MRWFLLLVLVLIVGCAHKATIFTSDSDYPDVMVPVALPLNETEANTTLSLILEENDYMLDGKVWENEGVWHARLAEKECEEEDYPCGGNIELNGTKYSIWLIG
ncbi:MAG: hypothetical protein ACLFP2_05130 [Candidatus Woesearchaeota archaeon]